MANTVFNIGDVVQLKSGGPPMTVVKAGPNEKKIGTVWCEWFEEKTQNSAVFPSDAVNHVTKSA